MRSTRKEEQPRVLCNRGIDQSSDDLLGPIGAFRDVTNMRIRAGGLLEKRAGTMGMTGTVATGMPGAGRRITGDSSFVVDKPALVSSVRDLPLLGTTSGKLFALDRGADLETWHFQGHFAAAKPVRERFGAAMANTVGQGGSAITSRGYVLSAVVQTTGVIQLRLESPDGAIVFASPIAVVNSTGKARVIAVGESFVVVYQDGTELMGAVIDPEQPAAVFVSVGTLDSSANYWDIDPYDATTWYSVYRGSSTEVFVRRMSGTTVVDETSPSGFSGNPPVSVFADSVNQRIWVGYYHNGDVSLLIYTVNLGSSVSVGLASAANIYGPPLLGRYRDYQSGGATAAKALALFRNVPTSGVCGTRIMTIDTAGNETTVQDLWGVVPISKPDNYNRFWGLITSQETANEDVQRVVLLQLTPQAISREQPPVVVLAAPPTPRVYTITPTGYYDLFHTIGVSDRTVPTAPVKRSVFSHVRQLAQDFLTGPMLQLRVYEYETGEQQNHQQALTLGTSTAIAGQPTQVFGELAEMLADGNGAPCAAEMGWAQVPTILSASAGSGSMPAGTYSVRAVYEWVDAYGARHLSAPSPPVIVTLSSTGGIDLEITAGTVTQRPGNAAFAGNNGVRVLIYRTVAGGTEHHLDQRIYTTATDDGIISTTLDGTGTGTGAIGEQEFLYTEGGVQQNDLAPSCRFMTKSEDRIWCGGLWNPRLLQCSKVLVPEEGPAFSEHPAFQVYLPDDCTGLAYQDGQVIVFCARSIYLISGDGPNDQGFGSFPPPRGYSQDLGCEDAVSIVTTRIGVIFRSPKGYYLIPRGFGPLQYIGASIRDELETNRLTKVYAAGVHGGHLSSERYGGHLARWLVGTPESTYATDVLTYDVDNGQWFKDTFEDAEPGGRMLEMGAWPDGFAFVNHNLNIDDVPQPIWYESGAFVGDASDAFYVQQKLRTARYHPFGPCGYGHVKRVQVGVQAAPTLACNLTLRVQLDDNTQQTATWPIPTGGLPQYRELPLASPQTCSTLRITVEDSALNGVMAPGVKLIALAFEADDSGGLRQLDIAERA